MTTKADLVDSIAKEAGLTKMASEKALNACLKTIKESFCREKKVKLKGFGTFSVIWRKERKTRHPQTGEKLEIPSKKVVKFQPGKKLQEEIASS